MENSVTESMAADKIGMAKGKDFETEENKQVSCGSTSEY